MFKIILLSLLTILLIYLVSNILSLLLLNMQINFNFKGGLNSFKLNSSLLGFFGIEKIYNDNSKMEEVCNDYLNDDDEKYFY